MNAAERADLGRAARVATPRESHAELNLATDRPDPVALLERQAASRVAELVPIRYGRMLVSPFTFFRGAALIMASDLAEAPASGLPAQICGDAHMMNFGVFATPERNLVFDINDFDETASGPWEWDVKRLTASVAIAGRDRGFADRERRAIVAGTVKSYRRAMREFAAMSNRDVWYATFDVNQQWKRLRTRLEPSGRQRARSALAKARTKDSHKALSRLTTAADAGPRIIHDPPLIVPIEEFFQDRERESVVAAMSQFVQSYRGTLATDRRHLLDGYELLHIARKVVGVGSVGTRAWVLLLMGRDHNDPLFLQAKEAETSVVEQVLGEQGHAHHGERVVAGQRLMQASSDIFLGWDSLAWSDGTDRDFYVRQLQDWKGSVSTDRMRPDGMALYGQICGWTLARAHARSGDRIAIAAYLGKGDVFDRAVAELAETYADLNARDHAALVNAVRSGRIEAESGV
jgi:uncharacterized protein (DUF2252 family)